MWGQFSILIFIGLSFKINSLKYFQLDILINKN